ncbi:putative ABC transport system permease protein [Hymenobacter luteus]|uniref:ABC transport system permease protein n=2 Tax=Hymenobacter TaxID=89966 RepID=A0ABR6JXI5_9BACT|nr:MULTISPECIES: ABC transporter permease [Hymenobacter]MBB4601436.1 putative ABC transport system permease protein [Hymenobacter latericoloratus]MBB6058357.1 putative ABC transport system permease protein [Hymenobacter luteus]
MLLSYLKIAWKVLLRRKFFTFISLFGISFTLMVLLVVAAMFDHLVGAHAPETRLNKMLFVNFMHVRWTSGGNQNSPPSYYLLDRYVRPLKTPEKVAVYSNFHATPSYVGNTRLDLDLKYTDEVFWQVLDFNFHEGKAFGGNEVRAAARVAVINRTTARKYFGTDTGVVGRNIEVNQTNYRVQGVVEDVPAMRFSSYADVWVPLTTSPNDLQRVQLNGDYAAIIQVKSEADIPAVQAEFDQMVKRVPLPDPKNMKYMEMHAEPLLASLSRQLMNPFTNYGSDGLTLLFSILSGIALLFMMLPALNLVNINVSRIMERSSEIGVRKAFGATSRTLIGQFLVENIFLTAIGGLLGLLLAYVALQLIGGSQVLAYAHFELNWRIFGVALLVTLIFGVLSGVYPAFKMSRLQPVQALKGGSK